MLQIATAVHIDICSVGELCRCNTVDEIELSLLYISWRGLMSGGVGISIDMQIDV